MSRLPDNLRSALDGAGLRPIDIALADWGWRHGGGRPGACALALVNHAIGLGHTCLPLDRLGEVLGEPAHNVAAERFQDELQDHPLVAGPAASESRPLVLDRQRLYLQRYWDYERRLAERLRHMLAVTPAPVDTAPLGPEGRLFDHGWADAGEGNWQAVAAFVAQRHRFAVISGGPGTGKTYTIVRLMIRWRPASARPCSAWRHRPARPPRACPPPCATASPRSIRAPRSASTCRRARRHCTACCACAGAAPRPVTTATSPFRPMR